MSRWSCIRPGNPFDALIVGCYEDERLLYTAKVRNGFVPQLQREVASRFKVLEIDTCLYAREEANPEASATTYPSIERPHERS